MKKIMTAPIKIYGPRAQIVLDYYNIVLQYMGENLANLTDRFRDIKIEGFDVALGSEGQVSLAINFSNVHTPSLVGFKSHQVNLYVSPDVTRPILLEGNQSQMVYAMPFWVRDTKLKKFLKKEVQNILLKGFNNEARYALVLEMFCKNHPHYRWEKTTPEIDQGEGIDYYLQKDTLVYGIDVKSSMRGVRESRTKHDRENEVRKKRGEKPKRRLFMLFAEGQSILDACRNLEGIIKPA